MDRPGRAQPTLPTDAEFHHQRVVGRPPGSQTGRAQVTFSNPVRGELIDIGAEYDGHFQVTFFHGDESLGTAPVPRANFPTVSHPYGPPGIQSRLVTVPPAARERGWTTAIIRGSGGDGNFVLSHFLVYHDVLKG